MDKVRFGVVGIGNMGTSHAKELAAGHIENAVLTAICDKKPARLAWAQENLPDTVTFSAAEEMYASGLIDAVIIAVPHYDHPGLAIKAFEHKIHVMCEKPAGVYTLQVKEMIAAAEKAEKDGVVFGIMFNQRTNCLYRKMKELVGELGEIKRTNWLITNWYRPQFYYDSGDWRATWAGEGGGVLLNQCPHNLDLWQWICGMPNKVTAFCHEGKWHDIEVEDDVTAYVEYPNGATGVFITSTGDAPGTNRFEITGDRGKLVCEDDKLFFYKLEESERVFNSSTKEAFGSPRYEKTEVETDGQNPQHNGVLTAFVCKIRGEGGLIADGAEGINGLCLSNAMHLSSWTKQTVTLPIDEKMFYEELQKKVQDSRKKENIIESVSGLEGSFS